MPDKKKRPKIECTSGPASNKAPKLKRMIKAGMNAARFNFSHGTHENHLETLKTVRATAKDSGEPVTTIADLQGPKIRVGDIPEKGIKLIKGKVAEFPVTYKRLCSEVKKGDRILLDDGVLEGKCVSGEPGMLKMKVVNGGTLLPHKGMNFPDSVLSISSLTAKDREDIEFIGQHDFDWVALSFVTNPKDVRLLRKLLTEATPKGKPVPRIICKIEKHEAINNFDAILKETDGIMVARGDLGIEIPAEKVPLVQKMIIDTCREAAKPVIVATQMLDSMIRNPRPTRAEVSDVANAVIDHTDAVMLSGETATGKYPVESVKTMARIVTETESSHYDDVPVEESTRFKALVQDAVSGAANVLAHTVDAKLILVATLSGNAARMVSRFRPELPIIAATASDKVKCQLNLSWSVTPTALPRVKNVEDLIKHSINRLKKDKLVKKGDRVIILAGQPVGKKINFVEVKEI